LRRELVDDSHGPEKAWPNRSLKERPGELSPTGQQLRKYLGDQGVSQDALDRQVANRATPRQNDSPEREQDSHPEKTETIVQDEDRVIADDGRRRQQRRRPALAERQEWLHRLSDTKIAACGWRTAASLAGSISGGCGG